MKTLLICHKGAGLSRTGLSRWLASFSQLVGIIEIEEDRGRIFKRIKREVKRVGPIRFLDVIAFRFYYKIFLSRNDAEWESKMLDRLVEEYPGLSVDVPVLTTNSPISEKAEEFISSRQPELMVVRCKSLLKESIFSKPSKGSFVMHPGICPEYRNAHGCFWALVNSDMKNVGMTLLKIDNGVDTGPIYGYYSYPFDEVVETPFVIQNRVVLENLHTLKEKLLEIFHGNASPIDSSGRPTHVWGQPWLTAYLKWRKDAKRRNK